MPLVEVTLVEGRTPEQLRTLISRLTAAVVDSVGAPKENVRVVLREVPATHWAAGDVTIAGAARMSDTWAEVADRVYVRRHQSMDLNVSADRRRRRLPGGRHPGHRGAGPDLVEAIRTVTPHPWIVVNTHFHFDHTLRQQRLPAGRDLGPPARRRSS